MSSQTFSYRQPPRASRFGSPLVLSRVHWVRPELVADVKFLTRTDDNLLRQVVYEGLRPRSEEAALRCSGNHIAVQHEAPPAKHFDFAQLTFPARTAHPRPARSSSTTTEPALGRRYDFRHQPGE